MSVWEEITVGNGPFGVVVIPVVVPGGTSPLYRITGPQPIGGAIIESGRERAVEIAAELNRLTRLPAAMAEDLRVRSLDRWEAISLAALRDDELQEADMATARGMECRAIAAMLERGAIDP